MVKKIALTLCFIYPILFSTHTSWGQIIQDDTLAKQYTTRASKFASDLSSDSAIVYYQKAADIYKKQSQLKQYYLLQAKIARQYMALRKYVEAKRLIYQHMISLTTSFSMMPEVESMYYYTLGDIAYYENRFRETLKLVQQAKAYHRDRDMQYFMSQLLIINSKSYLAYFTEALQMIDDCFQQLNQLPQNKENKTIKVKLLIAQARTKIYQRAFDEGLDICYTAEQELNKLPKNPWYLNHQLVVYSLQAMAYKNQRKFELTKRTYHQSIRLTKQILGNKHRELAFNYMLLGRVFLRELQLKKKAPSSDSALYYLKKSATLYKEVRPFNRAELGHIYVNIGAVQAARRNYKLAEKNYRQANELLQDAYGKHSPYLVNLYGNWSGIYWESKQYDKELEVLQKQLMANSRAHRDSNIYTNPKTSDYYNIIFKIGGLSNKAQAFANRGKNTQDYEQSLRHFLIADKVVKHLYRSVSRKNDRLLVAGGIDNLNSGNHGKNTIHVCNELYQRTKQKAYLDTAFYFIERGNASYLMSTLAESNAKKFAKIDAKLLKQETYLRKHIAQYQNILATKKEGHTRDSLIKFNALYERLIQQLEQKYPKYAQLKFDTKQASIPQIQAHLGQNEALLSYSFARNANNHVLLITKEQTRLLYLPLTGHVNDYITPYYNEIQSEGSLQSFAKTSHHLYQVLLLPLEKYLKDIDELVIIAPSLESTPFEALVSKLPPKSLGNDFSRLDYLSNRFQISYHYSATLWYQAQQEAIAHKQKLDLVAFAPFSGGKGTMYSTVRGSGLNLPESKVEVSAIFNLCKTKGLDARISLSTSATKARFIEQAKQANIVHIASHSEANLQNAGLAKVRFVGCNDGKDLSGCLLASEVYNLELNADLLVLSSCESGVGKLVKGEGVFSLARSFLYAGARNIVFSLWEVDDVYTRELMVAFYQQFLGKNNVSYVSALRFAQQKLMHKGVHPKHWAGIVLIGK